MKGSALALAACLAAAAGPAFAAVVDVTFSATDGSDLSGSFFYDSAELSYAGFVSPEQTESAFAAGSPAYITYQGITKTIDSYFLDTKLQTVNYENPYSDLFEATGASVPVTDGIVDFRTFDLRLTDDTGSSLIPLSLPTSFNVTSGTLTYFDELINQATGEEQVLANVVTPVSATFSAVSPTPELPAWASLLLGLGLAGGAVWWKRRTSTGSDLRPSFA